jgi:hypothetical protein
MNSLSIFTLAVGLWLLVNGILHDLFVLRSEYGKQYNRDLLRLLMDGHIMITCGLMLLISVSGISGNASWAYYISGAACISILIYCAMIFPFLKSVVTILLNAGLLVFLVINFLNR